MGVAGACIPVIGQALALKRRLNRLADNQLFVALSASQTSAENLPRSIAALEAQVQALTRAVAAVRESFRLWGGLHVGGDVRAVASSFRALIDVLR